MLMLAMQQERSLSQSQIRSSTKRSISISRGSAAYPRKRAVTACQVCRARRTKCDQKKPSCSFCESIGAECNSDPGSLSTFDPASIAIIERLDSLERKIDSIPQVSLPDKENGSNKNAHHKRPIGNFLPENLDGILKWPVFRHLTLPVAPTPSHCSPASLCSSTQAPSISDELHPAACNQWLDDFFRHGHCKNPVLDEQSTRRLVRKVCQEGVGWDSESCLALLVCANGALARPLLSPSVSTDEFNSSIPNALFTTSLKRLGPTLGSAGVVQAQCLFLAGVFLMSTLRPFDAWRMFLQSLAICQSFTYCDQPDPLGDGRSRSTVEAEGSIYWSAWKSERELRWELGLPDFGDMGLDIPRTFPSCSESYEGDNLRAWYFYLSEISLWRLETAVKNEMRRLVAETPAQVLEALAEIADENVQQVIAWQDSLPPSVSIAEHDLPTGDDGDILRFVLRGRTTYFHELVSWPFIYAVVNDEEDAPRVRQWTARGFAFHLERLSINRPGFYHRHHGTWLMIRSSARSACILLAGAQVSSTSELLPPNWQEAVEATISMLQFWCNDNAELAITVDILNRLFSNVYQQQ
ncbi:uncharacterized protein PAC_14976 [Phialocephala subalpina]|uniref:Zn(2)-C6 fungal-type domain-containing protein n=1 Tax=Phialocephala subalpina TaxID=576137 RepID=A0A1L7XJF9_9HELO|nr:uncharacterized protein PAC_14976 [Phialocephala subalpina]